MKKILAILCVLIAVAGAKAATDETAGKKIYECPYVADPPNGATAWAQSERFRNPKNVESRFVDYNSDAAKGLVLDATAERDVTKEKGAAARATSFSMAYNDKGWYIYIEGEEPLIGSLLDSIVDPKSPGRSEGYEVFFTPGMHGVPYYQIMTKTFANEDPAFVDWGMSHRHYRSLKPYAKVESVPLEKGSGTFIFIPWESLYEWVPVSGDYWRFTIIRWMPFGKAGGVTWSGQVHDTGNFGLIHFQPPTAAQKLAIETRILRAAWFTYLAKSKALAAFWSDTKLGDQGFFEQVLKPEIDRNTAAGQALGDPSAWTAESLDKARALMGDWMEFNYKVSELRTAYLVDKRFAECK